MNFSPKELKMLLIDKLEVNPIMYYECMLLSPVDKVFEFNDKAIFYNLVLTRDHVDEEPLIIRIIRKNNFAVVVVREFENDTFKIPDQIAQKFKFKLVKTHNMQQNTKSPIKPLSILEEDDKSMSSDSFPGLIDNPNNRGEIGKIMIQKIRTIKLEKRAEVTIDYLLFWITSEGLKKVENLINDYLLNEVNVIQEQSRHLGVNSKEEFSQKMDLFQNHYIGAQNAKESKSNFFGKIIKSQLPSLEFRYLIRHLISRMSNLHNTTIIIERKLELARNTFQAAVDTNLDAYSRQLDQLMKKYSVVAVMFLPLQLITGMWGMNCKVPFQETDSTWPFYVL